MSKKTRYGDASRKRVSIIFQGPGAIAETLLSLIKVTDGVAAIGATSIQTPETRTLRITSIVVSIKSGAAAVAHATINLRQNPSGAALIGSQSEMKFTIGTPDAAVGSSKTKVISIPDGIEFNSLQNLGISCVAEAITNDINITLSGFEY